MNIKEIFICVDTFGSKKTGMDYYKLYTFDEGDQSVNDCFITEDLYNKILDREICFGDVVTVVYKPNKFKKLEPADIIVD